MIRAVTLSCGAVHMARQKMIVKHLEAIENFGSMDVLCSDKTGTLTSGDMMLDRHLDLVGRVSERPFLLASVNSSHQTGIKSPLDEAILKHGGLAISGYRKIDEIPFDFERRRLSVVVEDSPGRLLITKGASEGVPRWTPENRPVVDGSKPASRMSAPSTRVLPHRSPGAQERRGQRR